MHFRYAVGPVLLTFLATPATAQQAHGPQAGRILGQILDAETSQPIPDVAVAVPERDVPAVLTDATGRFALDGLVPGIYPLDLRHVAYGTHEQLVNVPADRTVEITIRLATQAIELDPIAVDVELRSPYLEDRGYYDRERLGLGEFFTRNDLDRWGLTTTLRQVPRLEIRPIRGSPFRYHLVFERSLRACSPPVWIDGMLIRLRDLSLADVIDETGIGAMEVFAPGQTPGEFMGAGLMDCGAVVIWSRYRTEQPPGSR